MAVRACWYDQEKTVIFLQFNGGWSLDQFERVYAWIIQSMDSVDHKVNFIVDATHMSVIPPGSLWRLKQAADYAHPNMGLAIWVGTNWFMKAIAEALFQMFPDSAAKYPFEFAKTIAEAEAKLERYVWQ